MSRPREGAPLLSVVVPTYNRCTYIDETLKSILDQDHPALQVVVVDDGSTDDTQAVLSAIAATDDRLVVVRQDNEGQSSAVNNGFRRSSGEYITLVSDDDPLLPGALSTLVAVLERDDEILVVYPDWLMVDETGKTIHEVRSPDYDLVRMTLMAMCFPGPCTTFRRRVLDQVGGWDTRYRLVADFDFWLRIGLLGPMRRHPEVLATWRRHPDSQTINSARERLAREMVSMVGEFLDRDDLPAELVEHRTVALHNLHGLAAVLMMPATPSRWLIQDLVTPITDDARIPLPPSDAELTARLHGEVARLHEELSLARREIEIRREIADDRSRIETIETELADMRKDGDG